MDASNHDMVGVLAREMGSIFSPLITNIARTNQDNMETYQRISTQKGRIADFFGDPETSTRRRNNHATTRENELILTPVQDLVRPPRQSPGERNQVIDLENQNRRTNTIQQEVPEEQPRVVMVNREQNADEIIHRVRRDNMATENNLTTLIERIMANNGLNTGLRRPNYTSHVADYILQTELPRGTKIPKFTKFSGDTSESTVEHITRYLTETGDLANSENLRIKYFPSSLTKNAFTWFTTLPLNSIDT
ncbi:uncharacterized protein LOC131648908 [Vicia villosa]|uniref:uncharacterized protein LOC131648908 n=1 Tax=Vicia villosa TaxID=3911 RepID=UPI00273BA7A1|nr:uncharacterized protein LOC131648908 [Vicia villosa]